MGKRDFILTLLQKYRGIDQKEERVRKRMISFISAHRKCFDNDFKEGHVTGSALVVDRSFKYTLLTHHSWINKWFQPGGHSDGENNAIEVGLREAKEETGLSSLSFIPGHEGIFDVDIHPIPKHEAMPGHYHYDIRIILTADKKEKLTITKESKHLEWLSFKSARNLISRSEDKKLIDKAVLLRKTLVL